MDIHLLWLFIAIVFLLNICCFILYSKEKINLIVWGAMIAILAPFLGFAAGYVQNVVNPGETKTYGAGFIGVLMLMFGLSIWIVGLLVRFIQAVSRRLR
ncbi:hypothetical protein RYX56_01020 [Alkalihalophilus lindianensis]|uniref:YesK-like protein n=1 Tax=Alkalihalophilus lindianensis TaxID=1630542 RepID=A0ABU3X4Z3_9BACI|nr:hypothetical protein [Alkalihalophilus lindianensis]MDV2682947.1 hypothetical protein [Alkalihalophilus lindianensis]